ncbi:hypothetical protein KY349_04200 [Candidatus Woesearchaeota archaeon]|jgi:hypothetical protein|nr:hypothetical protein [Candidatus Woesearchaeota archaeon]
MATFLDIGLAQHFSVIFPVLLVFVIVFALLEKSKIFGENKGLHSLIALSIAIMMLFVPGVVQVIAVMAPWFVLLFLLIIFFFLLLLSFGTKWESIVSYASGGWETPHWFLLIIAGIVFVGALGAVYGGALLPFSEEPGAEPTEVGEEGLATDTGDFNQNVGRVIFHPKTLGLLFLLMVGSLTIRLLSVSKQ